jgi:Flp pilus assembly pilin Flp
VHLRANDPQRGAASVEHIGLAMLVATALLAGVAAFAAGPPVEEGRELGTAITRKLRCAPRLPCPCWRDPLTDAYGRPLAGLVRALAPAPEPRAGAGEVPLLVGVDFRSCRSAGCAAWTGDERLTASNRRTTAFTSVEDRRRTGGGVEVTYWIYRPSLGWERVVRRAGSADVPAAAKTPLLESSSPKLVPLETLAGRNHYWFHRSEQPPWRWQVESVYPG